MDQNQGGARETTLLGSVTEIVSTYLKNNQLQASELSGIISTVTQSLRAALSET